MTDASKPKMAKAGPILDDPDRSTSLIDEVIIHCSATRPSMDTSASDVHDWHLARGWRGIGYHYVIKRDGTIEEGRSLAMRGAHTMNHNNRSVGVCMIGGLAENGEPSGLYTALQWRSLRRLVRWLMETFDCQVSGHNKYANKACPSFDVSEWIGKVLSNEGAAERTIDVGEVTYSLLEERRFYAASRQKQEALIVALIDKVLELR